MKNHEDRAERLKIALFFGQHQIVSQLLDDDPELGRANLGLAIALYDVEHVVTAVKKDTTAATSVIGVRSPICHLAFSQHIHGSGVERDMLDVVELLVDNGADVNDFYNYNGDPNSPLSVLYGALGHANNLALARWLLKNGANPNDGESLYHSTELGHREGLRLLLNHGADPSGTNALPRALDFNDHEAVRLLLDAGADPNEGVEEHPSGEPPWVIPALHQAARRLCDEKMIRMLLDAGADPSHRYKDITPYAMARTYGNSAAAKLIEAAGGNTALSKVEVVLAAAADDDVQSGAFASEAELSDEYQKLICTIVALPDKLDHVKRLVTIGLDPNRIDAMGLPPVQIAGWEGLPDAMAYFMGLNPDLGHINNFGGTLLSTIIHGSENCPSRGERDHISCARIAFQAGVDLPLSTIEFAGEPRMSKFLVDWAERNPGQVVES